MILCRHHPQHNRHSMFKYTRASSKCQSVNHQTVKSEVIVLLFLLSVHPLLHSAKIQADMQNCD